jgi:S1-C subfamily serine protease
VGTQPGSVTEKAGLHVGYIITSVDGKAVTGPAELETEVYHRVPGTKIRLGYRFRSSALNSRTYYSNEAILLVPPK